MMMPGDMGLRVDILLQAYSISRGVAKSFSEL